MFEETSGTDINIANIASWRIDFGTIYLENPEPDAETLHQAEKYFKLTEVKKKN